MKKVLFTATVDSHILAFHLPYLKYFKENGYEVHVATSSDAKIPYCDKKIKISFERSPFKLNNIKAIGQLKKIINKENYRIIHTHTPMGSVVTRLASKKARKNGTKIIYTAHGFHFFKGAPKLNWLLFYPVEKYLAKYTDDLITINHEDYELAKKKFKTKVHYIPGVGIDTKKFDFEMSDKEQIDLKKSLGLKNDDFIMIYPAELNKNKNQILLIDAMEILRLKYNNIHLILAGKDSYNGYYQKIVESKKLGDCIHFLGFRKDIPKLLKISNLSVASSLREGLPVNIIEAMYMGLPIVTTDCRGVSDLIDDNHNGFIIPNNDKNLFAKKIEQVYLKQVPISKIRKINYDTAKKYLLSNVLVDYAKVYNINQKTKILHLLASNKYSGAENVVCTIIENFSNNIEMAYCSPNGSIKEVLDKRGIKYYSLNKMSVSEVKKVIKEYNPDIIHAHDYTASVITTFTDFKGKIISHLHNNCPFAKKWNLKTIMYNYCIPKFYKVVGVSNQVYEEAVFKKKLGNKYTTIYNYVDKDYILKKCDEYTFDKKYDLFFIGRLTEQKDPLLFINIVKDMNDKHIKAVMIGDGKLKEECINKIEEYNLKDNIDMLGFVQNPFPIIKNSKICVMPSKWEGFGLTAVESMILSKPVLNSGVGGLGEIFKNNNEYICVDKTNYIEVITRLLSDEKFYDNCMSEIKNIIINYTDKEKYIEKLNKIYFE